MNIDFAPIACNSNCMPYISECVLKVFIHLLRASLLHKKTTQWNFEISKLGISSPKFEKKDKSQMSSSSRPLPT